MAKCYDTCGHMIFSSPGRSPGRAIVLPPASLSALALASALAAVSALAVTGLVMICCLSTEKQ